MKRQVLMVISAVYAMAGSVLGDGTAVVDAVYPEKDDYVEFETNASEKKGRVYKEDVRNERYGLMFTMLMASLVHDKTCWFETDWDESIQRWRVTNMKLYRGEQWRDNSLNETGMDED